MPDPASHPDAFEKFASQKTREAESAAIERLTTVVDRRDPSHVRGIGNAWSQAHYGGDFGVNIPEPSHTALSLVFVQSKDGNTGQADPSALGGGATDTHLIYEGLSRVAADAVIAGAGTVHAKTLFSVWHPELVALRTSLGLPRHPAQIVVSKRGGLNMDAVVFNVPDVRVFLIAGSECIAQHGSALRARPWIQQIQLNDDNLRPAVDHLRRHEGIQRISAVGGRFTATRLVDEGLAQDIYLTTTSRDGGEPGTPWYSGTNSPRLTLITKKEWNDGGSRIVFEHSLIG